MIIPQLADNLTRSGAVPVPEVCPVCGKPTRIREENETKTQRRLPHLVAPFKRDGMARKFRSAPKAFPVCDIIKGEHQPVRRTRGNGEVGEIITNNARVFKNIPLSIPFHGELVLRGCRTFGSSESTS